ncbi:hypothetical protein [Litoribacter populi]|uniref:hypothetical protein n=1 Tax=Litoribacter populi TaxID=2598460 RepID=UPI0011812F05|nr:hypothetical protein [Litoribacter populi]
MSRFYTVAILLMFCSFSAVGQTLQNYEGPYRIGETEEGEAKFTYYTDGEDERVISGPFTYENQFFDEEGKFVQRDFSGSYVDGLKNGKWNYSDNVFDINIRSVTDRLQILADLNGFRTRLEANYQDGKAHGSWALSEQKIEDGKVAGFFTRIQMNFNEGRMVGRFAFQGEDGEDPIKIEGSFSNDHFFDGTWRYEYVLDSVPVLETRIYDDGFLINLEIEDKKNNITLFDIEFEEVQQKLGQVRRGEEDLGFTIGDTYFGYLFDDGFPDFSEEEVSQKVGNELLSSILGQFTNKEMAGLRLSGVEELQAGVTRRFEYTYTEDEQEALEEVDRTLSQYISDIQKFVNNTSLSLNRQRSDSLAFTYKYLDNTLNKFELLQENVKLLQSEEFKYQSREFYYADGIEGIYQYDTITYTYDEEERVRIYDNRVSLDGEGVIFNIKEYVEGKTAIVDQIDPFVRQSIREIERDMVSQQLEQDMLVYMDSVTAVFNVSRGMTRPDANQIPLSRALVTLYESYQRKLDSKMQRYSNAEGFEKKQEAGLEIVELSQIYIDSYEVIGRLPERLETLDQSYTKLSYNPYMDRYDIPTRIKRNIYFAAIDHLIPHYRNAILTAEDYRELPELTRELDRIFDRLIEISKLEDSETSTIERRLRRESNPDRIKRQLDI